jgi:formate/nitrite transporter FocA (FNT family)
VPSVLLPLVCIIRQLCNPGSTQLTDWEYVQATAAGQTKAGLSISKTFIMGILGGTFIGFGSFLALSVGGACPGLASTNPGLQKMVYGAFGLPFGLLLVLMCGAELFTGNTALVTASVSSLLISQCTCFV